MLARQSANYIVRCNQCNVLNHGVIYTSIVPDKEVRTTTVPVDTKSILLEGVCIQSRRTMEWNYVMECGTESSACTYALKTLGFHEGEGHLWQGFIWGHGTPPPSLDLIFFIMWHENKWDLIEKIYTLFYCTGLSELCKALKRPKGFTELHANICRMVRE